MQAQAQALRYWLANYPQGVPADIDPDRYRSLAHLLEESMARHADRPALLCMGKVLSFRQVEQLSRALAAWLQALALPDGARVALMMPNCLPYVVSLFAVVRAGLVAVNINPMYTARELELQLKDSGAEVIIVLENFGQTLEQILPASNLRHVLLVSMGDLQGWCKGWLIDFVLRHVRRKVPAFRLPGALRFGKALARGRRLSFQPPAIKPGQLAFLQYTGGTTGVPKGAMLSHRNMVANVLQDEAWFAPVMHPDANPDGTSEPSASQPSAQHVFVGALPLYHAYALMVCLLVCVQLGGKLVLIPNPRDLDSLVKALKSCRMTVFPGVSTLYSLLLDHAGFRALDFSGLRLSVAGGMAVPETVSRRWQETTGCAVCEGYGLSEASPTVACTPTNTRRHDGTAGMPLPSTEIRIVGDDGREVARGEVGEVTVRGPQVMLGYWQRPDETAACMTDDGFLRTGDLGIMDQRGFLRLVDRKKDVILVSGFNVYSSEVEEVVCTHPGVRECAVIGVPDERCGELVAVYVVRSDPALSANALMAYCAARLTGYKRPRSVLFVRWLPKSVLGKVLRRALREPSVVLEYEADGPAA